ncbi:phosphoenolpyruvate synthase [Hydrogenispora ethanolica]|nr:phosphoenolpyruvate synthase [Hydrogenispora ethanolica]
MNAYVLGFAEIDQTKLMEVGGKGANLGELSRIDGLRVPPGFCVTTAAYRRIIGQTPEFGALLAELSQQSADDREKIGAISGRLRSVISEAAIPGAIRDEILRHLTKLGEANAYAVRSSATAEDLPSASFAGQQDTYLNIRGSDAVLRAIRQCWASLFTDRAVIYRMQNGFDHSEVYLAVVVQRMVFPQAAGILFTADPVSSNRKVLSIDAGFGLGEALVSGLVNADNYKVREGRIVDRKIAAKKLAIAPAAAGGTGAREIEPELQEVQTLTDGQILQLERIGRTIEGHFGCPQDIEWCLAEEEFFIVQSRPITTLFPIPEHDGGNRIYASLGHQQMMTDAIKPLGLSFFRLLSKKVPLYDAGGRLFFDLSHDLASPLGRQLIFKTWGKADPAMLNAIESLMERQEFRRSLARGRRYIRMGTEGMTWDLPVQALKVYLQNDTGVIDELVSQNELSLQKLRQAIVKRSGTALFPFILEDLEQFKKIMYDPRGMGVILVGLYAANWINKHMETWLGEKSAADTLAQSVPNNITSEMGLALLDVADVVRQYPAVMEYFQHASDERFFEELAPLEGGAAVQRALEGFLDQYGMRCPGEIDITRPRWSEKPTALIPAILSNIKNCAPNAASVKFEQGRLEAERKERDLVSRLEKLPGGKRKARKTRRMISLLRHFIGYREYPKYTFIQRYWIYKQALLQEAAKLVRNGLIREKEDVYYLAFDEFREAVRTNRLDYRVIAERKAQYQGYEKLTPPRVLTSEGENVAGAYRTGHLPPGALPGIPVSAGVIEGRARVVLKMADAVIENGDILVTVFTDPSWTPVFVSVKGLVTEVGGMMTHGAVIAREYGLPAVVGVDNATKFIRDGQRIRVNGTEGYVELL